MATGWVKRNSDGKLVTTNSKNIVGKQEHLDALKRNGLATMAESEFTFGIDSDDVVSSWLLIQETADDNTWERKIRRTDSGMPRYAEDILDGMADKSGVAQITLDRLQAKKELRATKP